MKLDRAVAKHQSLGRSTAHHLIAAGRVTVQGIVCRSPAQEVSRFEAIALDGHIISPAETAHYLMLHKPAGYLSATVDAQWPTVLELIDLPDKGSIHLVGRLDRASTGLLLLTNDGRWSKAIMNADAHVQKIYHVTTDEDLPDTAVAAFAQGFYFHTEGITTRPAVLEPLGPRQARVYLSEGRYHQIKRMFHRIGLRVQTLHREAIGQLQLPSDLPPGQWLALSEQQRLAAIAS